MLSKKYSPEEYSFKYLDDKCFTVLYYMYMSKEMPVVIKDSKEQRNIVISVDLKKGTTTVFSGFSAWENLALIMEGLAVTTQKCIEEGMEKKEVYSAIKDYLMKVLDVYKIKLNN